MFPTLPPYQQDQMHSLDLLHHLAVTEAPPSPNQGNVREGQVESQDFHSCWALAPLISLEAI